jgi:spermidine synthase
MEYLFVVGFVSILGQVVLLRELNVAFFGVELIYTLALGIWLLFTGCGAMISRKSENPSFAKINSLLLLLSVAIPLDVVFIRSARLLASEIPGAYLPLQMQIAIVAASLLPIGLFLGLLFQWTARVYISDRKSLASAYAIESVGGIAGGVCATLFLRFGFQNFLIALLCALAAAGSCFLHIDLKSRRWVQRIAAVTLAILSLLIWKADPVDHLMTSWTHPNLAETRDTPYSRVTVTDQNGQVSVFENDALLFDTEGTRAEEFVQLAALQHPGPKRILILGGGIEGIVREALGHSPLRVDYVELNPMLIDVVPRHLPPYIRQSLQASNVRIIYDDPRRFLDHASRYDLILIGMPEPASGQANRFYTKEFFRQCASRLNDHGVVAFSLQSSENFWTPQLTRKMVSIYRAVRSVFRDALVLPGSTSVVLASNRALERSGVAAAQRLAERGIQTRLISPDYLRYLYANDRVEQIARVLESETAPMNSDTRPVCYTYTVMVWLSKFYPSSRIGDFNLPEMTKSRYGMLLAALALPALLLRRAQWAARRAVLAGIAGFTGMVLETVLILHYQTRNGILFQDIGILLTGFMTGLAFGALAVERIKHHLSRRLGVAILLGFSLTNALAGWHIASGAESGLPAVFTLLLLTGFFVAALFAVAGFLDAPDQRRIVAPLYSADLLGGCAGSVLASLILAPIAGMAATIFLIIPVALFAALLL